MKNWRDGEMKSWKDGGIMLICKRDFYIIINRF